MFPGANGVSRWVSQPVAVATAITLLFSLAVSLRLVKERRYTGFTQDRQILCVPSPGVLERLALSFDAVLANVYWIRVLQHYGGTRRATEGPKEYERAPLSIARHYHDARSALQHRVSVWCHLLDRILSGWPRPN